MDEVMQTVVGKINEWIAKASDFVYNAADSDAQLFMVLFLGFIVILWLILRK
jgi:hypothetical protein